MSAFRSQKYEGDSMSRPIFTRTFWFDAAERAVKTFAQTAAALVGADGANMFGADFDLGQVAGLSGTAAALSILSSLASAPIGGNGTASVIDAPPGPVATEV